MKKFLVNSILFSLATLAFLILFGYLLEYRFSKDTSNKVIWLQNIKDQQFDYAFLGSSRASDVIDITQLDTACETNGINLGLGGADFRTSYMVLYSFLELQNNNLDQIYLQVDPFMFYRDSIYSKPSFEHYFYSLAKHEEISSCFEDKTQVALNYYFPIIKYIKLNKVFDLVHFIRSFSKTSKFDKSKGSTIIYRYLPFHPPSIEKREEFIDFNAEELEYFLKILEFNKRKNINTVLFTAPVFGYDRYYHDAYPNFRTQMEKWADKYQLKYQDLSARFQNKEEFFVDMIHLNAKGATKLTELIIPNECPGETLISQTNSDTPEEKN